MPTEQSIGDWIKSEREQRELTQRGLAELADIHWTSLSAVERGEREPTADLIIKLAQTFDSTAEELVLRLASAGIWKKTIINGTGGRRQLVDKPLQTLRTRGQPRRHREGRGLLRAGYKDGFLTTSR